MEEIPFLGSCLLSIQVKSVYTNNILITLHMCLCYVFDLFVVESRCGLYISIKA